MGKKVDKKGFGIALTRAMDKGGYSQTDFAREIEVDPAAVRKWENGKNFPTKDKWNKLKRELGLDPQAFITYGDETTQNVTASGGSTAVASGRDSAVDSGIQLTDLEREFILLNRRYGNEYLLQKDVEKRLKLKEQYE